MKRVDARPNTRSGNAIRNRLIRSGTSVGAQHRATCRARSKAEFIAKIGVVEEEADERACWMERIVDGQLLPARKVSTLLPETNELTAIMVASRIFVSRRR